VAQSPMGTDTLAFIEKKYAGLNVITTPVPEAETYAMMLAGLGLIGFAVRRRSA
ncbi:MAG: FxDxF family PEP-CTERM protein, partial [Deltaproteobacteria bacterium]|nr:FxDxF family PEP-CTERM protein [Deltaproteobacteria bacterium]